MAETKAPPKPAAPAKAPPADAPLVPADIASVNKALDAVAHLCDAHLFTTQAVTAIASARRCSPDVIIQFAQLGEIAVDARRKAPKGEKDRVEDMITEAYAQLSRVAIGLLKQNCRA